MKFSAVAFVMVAFLIAFENSAVGNSESDTALTALERFYQKLIKQGNVCLPQVPTTNKYDNQSDPVNTKATWKHLNGIIMTRTNFNYLCNALVS